MVSFISFRSMEIYNMFFFSKCLYVELPKEGAVMEHYYFYLFFVHLKDIFIA